MYVCKTIFMYVCETTFMHVCETTLCNIQMTLFEHFKFSNLKKWQVRTRFSTIKWFQLKKWWISKLYNSTRSTTFILIISSSDKVIVNIVHKSTCFSYSSWNYESYLNLWTMFANTLSYEEVTKIKVIDSEDFNNFMFITFIVEII